MLRRLACLVAAMGTHLIVDQEVGILEVAVQDVLDLEQE